MRLIDADMLLKEIENIYSQAWAGRDFADIVQQQPTKNALTGSVRCFKAQGGKTTGQTKECKIRAISNDFGGIRKIMKKWVIARPINGISINGDEYLFDENEKFFVYGNEEEAAKALKDMFSESEAEEQGVYVKEIEVEENADIEA